MLNAPRLILLFFSSLLTNLVINNSNQKLIFNRINLKNCIVVYTTFLQCRWNKVGYLEASKVQKVKNAKSFNIKFKINFKKKLEPFLSKIVKVFNVLTVYIIEPKHISLPRLWM